jgi:hypothetical protein
MLERRFGKTFNPGGRGMKNVINNLTMDDRTFEFRHKLGRGSSVQWDQDEADRVAREFLAKQRNENASSGDAERHKNASQDIVVDTTSQDIVVTEPVGDGKMFTISKVKEDMTDEEFERRQREKDERQRAINAELGMMPEGVE